MTNELLFFDKRTLELKYQIPINRIKPFFQGLEEGKILATQCNQCNTLYFPPQADCPKCKTNDMQWVELTGEATLETYTVINVKPTSFSKYPDYIVAIGNLKEGVKVLSWLNIPSSSELKLGMPLKLKVVKRDKNYYTYEFFVP